MRSSEGVILTRSSAPDEGAEQTPQQHRESGSLLGPFRRLPAVLYREVSCDHFFERTQDSSRVFLASFQVFTDIVSIINPGDTLQKKSSRGKRSSAHPLKNHDRSRSYSTAKRTEREHGTRLPVFANIYRFLNKPVNQSFHTHTIL